MPDLSELRFKIAPGKGFVQRPTAASTGLIIFEILIANVPFSIIILGYWIGFPHLPDLVFMENIGSFIRKKANRPRPVPAGTEKRTR